MAGVATACLKWVDVLENQFDKSFVDMDLLYNELDEEEDVQIGLLCRKHASSLASCFSQLVHKATVIFQNNAKLEAQLLYFREELVQFEQTQKKLVKEKNYLTQALVTALAENHLLKHTLPVDKDCETTVENSEEVPGETSEETSTSITNTEETVLNTKTPSPNIEDHTCDKQEIQKNLELRMESELEHCDPNYSSVMKRLQLKNEELRVEVLELESELVGARLDNVYLDKELAGRIQQIQILASGTPPGVKERLWTQIEAEMCLQRSKTIAQICKSKQTLRSKQVEADAPSDSSEQRKHSEDNRKHSEASFDMNGEDQHYSKGKQVTVLKNPADDLGMAIIGGEDHNLPIIISEVFPNSAVYRSNKIQAGDIILSANEQDFSSLTHEEAVKFLSSLRGQISFQLMASETVCEDDPSNLNFRFYRIFDADHTMASPSKHNPQQKNHPGKAVPDYVAPESREVVKPLDLEAAASRHRVQVSPAAMSPVHSNTAPQKRSITPQVLSDKKEVVCNDNANGKVVELHEEDGSIAHV